MNLGNVINMAIGLIMTFAVMALVVSAVQEARANLFSVRSTNLRAGIQSLLNDPNMTGLAAAILNHGAVNPLTPGTGAKPAALTYVDPRQFANALVDVIQNKDPLRPLGLADAIGSIEDPQIKALLSGLYARADGKVEKLHDDLATWFDGAMNRVSDNYRRNAQVWALVVAVALALALNVDAFEIARAIWATPQMVAQVPQIGPDTASAMQSWQAINAAGFPMGWTDAARKAAADGTVLYWLAKLAGCLFTAAASMLGAPFWFNLLNQLRGSTSTPAPKPAVNP